MQCNSRRLFVKQKILLLCLASTLILLALNWVTYNQQLRPPTVCQAECVRRRISERGQRLTAKCHEYDLHRGPRNDTLYRPNVGEFLVSRQHHLIWCNVFKAASTSWLYNFNLLAGYDPALLNATSNHLRLARRKYPRVTADELARAQNDSLTFLIVRHPFERLASAYQDKIANVRSSYYANIRNVIIHVYRRKSLSNIYTRWPTFPEFVTYLLAEYNYRIKLDEHWTPIVLFCTPCLVRVDMILKFETLDEDQRYLIERANLSHLLQPQWRNRARTPFDSRLLYNQLSWHQIDALYSMFRYDFELFGYTVAGYGPSGSRTFSNK